MPRRKRWERGSIAMTILTTTNNPPDPQAPSLPRPGPAGAKETPSPPSDGGEGRGEEVRCVRMPLSSVLSPLLRRGERKKERAGNNLRTPRKPLLIVITRAHESN